MLWFILISVVILFWSSAGTPWFHFWFGVFGFLADALLVFVIVAVFWVLDPGFWKIGWGVCSLLFFGKPIWQIAETSWMAVKTPFDGSV